MNSFRNVIKPNILYPLYINSNEIVNLTANSNDAIMVAVGITAVVNLPSLTGNNPVINGMRIYLESAGNLTINAAIGDSINNSSSLSVQNNSIILLANPLNNIWVILSGQSASPATALATTGVPINIISTPPLGGNLLVATGPTSASWGNVALTTIPASRTLFVDKNRIDIYVQTGSVSQPFKTIMGAVDQIIINGDNSFSIAYAIQIVGAGIYSELVDLGNTKIINLTIFASRAITLAAPGGFGTNALQSLSNNNAQSQLNFQGLAISGNVQFVNPLNNSNTAIIQFLFIACSITGTLNVNNINYLTLVNCVIQGNMNFINTAQAYFAACEGFAFGYTTGIIATTDALAPMPTGLIKTGTFVFMQVSSFPQPMTINAGSEIDCTDGTCIGTNIFSIVTLIINGIVKLFGSSVTSNITVNSGGELIVVGGKLMGAVTLNPGSIYNSGGIFAGNSLWLGNLMQQVTTGIGSPNNILVAPIGSLYLRSDGGAGTTLYIKEANSGASSGWVSK